MKASVDFHKQVLGAGIFTASDICRILDLPLRKVRRYVKDYGDVRFGKKLFNETYTWEVSGVRAVNFYALIEMYVFFFLREKYGFSTQKINRAREVMAIQLNNPYPFASSDVLTDGKTILYSLDKDLVNADGTQQINIEELVKPFLVKIDFGEDKKAMRYWPLGRDMSVVIDPHHQYGQPTINGTNICTETIFLMYESGEDRKIIRSLYDLTDKQYHDVLSFYRQAA